GEIARVNAEYAVSGRRVGVIQSEIAGDEVRTAILVEIADSKTVPPATERRQMRLSGHIAQSLAIVPEKLDRHPLAHRYEIELAVAIEIDPMRVGNHPPWVDQLRSDLAGHVGETTAVITKDV